MIFRTENPWLKVGQSPRCSSYRSALKRRNLQASEKILTTFVHSIEN
jgi:hypothetical protein